MSMINLNFIIPARNVQNDIALVKLSKMAELNEGVRVACLPLGK